MGTNYLDLIAIILYFVALFAFGILVRRVKGFEDYSLGKRMVPSSMIFASLAATYIGPGFSVGLTGKGFSTGYLFYLLPLAFVIQTLIVGRLLYYPLGAYCHYCFKHRYAQRGDSKPKVESGRFKAWIHFID